MINILTVIGARPQIIKAAAISRAIRTHYSQQVCEHILHTGQHYDEQMSDVFFRELNIPVPEINLHVGSDSHGAQTSRMIEGIEQVLLTDTKKYDGVIVYGDTNSTLAAAIAAGKLHVPVFHIEAGLRSFDMSMPEEINRIVCDQLSSILFTPTLTGMKNLEAEGFATDGIKTRVRFANGRGQRVILSGDVMYDNALYFSKLAENRSTILQQNGLHPKAFVLATIHRPANTDVPANMQEIFRTLLDIAEKKEMDVVLPLHPRTRKLFAVGLGETMLRRIEQCRRLHLMSPVSFLDMISLEKNAAIVLTDSGGVQKEAFFYRTPCIILRSETEWTEIVEAGAGIIAGADYERIMAAFEQLLHKQLASPTLFGDGQASEKIVKEIIDYYE